MCKLTVLMSVYSRENPRFLSISLKSILEQTYNSYKVVIVADGALGRELYDVIDAFKIKFQEQGILLELFQISKSVGLARALNYGLKKIDTKYVARMDSDDFSYSNRLEVEMRYLDEHKNISLVGTNIGEFESNPEKIESIKKMPANFQQIKKYSKLRNPFCHPTVVFKRDVIMSVGCYENFKYFEDYHLWMKVLNAGFYCANITTPLVNMRVGDGLFNRRGGIRYFIQMYNFRRNLLKKKYITIIEFTVTVLASGIPVLLPTKIRKSIYMIFLRKKRIK